MMTRTSSDSRHCVVSSHPELFDFTVYSTLSRVIPHTVTQNSLANFKCFTVPRAHPFTVNYLKSDTQSMNGSQRLWYSRWHVLILIEIVNYVYGAPSPARFLRSITSPSGGVSKNIIRSKDSSFTHFSSSELASGWIREVSYVLCTPIYSILTSPKVRYNQLVRCGAEKPDRRAVRQQPLDFEYMYTILHYS